MPCLQELDSLEIHVLIDNELDPISPNPQPDSIAQTGGMKEISQRTPLAPSDRGAASVELRMDCICCSAHGLSLLLIGTKDGIKHTLLFDTGPEGAVLERNVRRLRVEGEVGAVERVVLSHWHRDHSGGMLDALSMIEKENSEAKGNVVVVDLHPNRPAFRGGQSSKDGSIMSMEADPSFAENEAAGAKVQKYAEAHSVLEDFFLVSGEIPRVTAYELGLKQGMRFLLSGEENGAGKEGKWVQDTLIQDERFVVCHVKDKGLILLTGCSHAGVVNASRHAMELVPKVPLYAITGGYHLADANADLINATIRDLKALKPKIMLAGHCTGWRAKFAIEREMPGRLVPSFVGMMYAI